MPLTVGGGVRTVEDIRRLLLAGADKVSINTAAVNDRPFVGEAARKFGDQCIVVAIDAKAVSPGTDLGDLHPRRPQADRDRRRRVRPGGGRAGRRRAARHLDGPRRHQGRLRPRARRGRSPTRCPCRSSPRAASAPSTTSSTGVARGPCQRRAGRLDLPFRRALDRRRRKRTWPRAGLSDAAAIHDGIYAGRPRPASSASAPAAPPDQSYTAKLLAGGPARAAKKLGEEAVEAVIAAVQGDRAALTAEAADVLYHLLVVLQAGGVPLQDVMAELERRTARSGLAEKAARRACEATARELRPIGSAGTPVAPPPDEQPVALSRPSRARSGRRCAPTRPLTLDGRRGLAAAVPQRSDLARGGDRDLPAAVAPAVALRRGHAGPVQGDAALPPRRERGQGSLHHRGRRLGRGRQVDHGPRPQGAARALAEHAEGRSRHHRRLPAAQRGADAPRA